MEQQSIDRKTLIDHIMSNSERYDIVRYVLYRALLRVSDLNLLSLVDEITEEEKINA